MFERWISSVIATLLLVLRYTDGDILTFCSPAPVTIVTNQTSEIITEWFPGWSFEHACVCSASVAPSNIPLSAFLIFGEDDVTNDVVKTDCGPLMIMTMGDSEKGDVICPTLTSNEQSFNATAWTVQSNSVQFALWNPGKRRIRLQIKFSSVHVSDIHMSCSPLSADPSITSTKTVPNEPCPCSALSGNTLDNEKKNREAVLIGVLVPVLLLFVCSFLILLLWLRFGKTKYAWGAVREKRKLQRKLSTSSSLNRGCSEVEVEYRVQSNLSNTSSQYDTMSTLSSKKPTGLNLSETFDRGNTTFSGYGDLTAYGLCWTNPDVVRTENGGRQAVDVRQNNGASQGMRQGLLFNQANDENTHHQLKRKSDRTKEFGV